MIALMYLLLHVQSGSEEELVRCVDSALNNIDLINYEVNENYSEGEVVTREVSVVEKLLDAMVKLNQVDTLGGLSIIAVDLL